MLPVNMALIVKVLCTDYIVYKVAVIVKDIHAVQEVMYFLSPLWSTIRMKKTTGCILISKRFLPQAVAREGPATL